VAAKLKIGTRPSPLAIAQVEIVRAKLAAILPTLATEIVPIRTSGDKLTTPSLANVGGKGLFIKELEQALAEHRIDVAVHSMKDIPAALPREFRIAAVPERENPADVLVTRDGAALEDLPSGTRLGTTSPRRHFMALRINPRITIQPLRGNVDTRISRVTNGELDAAILALAAIKRLDRLASVKYRELDPNRFISAGGQAALAIESLGNEKICGSDEVARAIERLNDPSAVSETIAERAFLAALSASCTTPVGVRATLTNDRLAIRAILFSVDGTRSIDAAAESLAIAGDRASSSELGRQLASEMIARGARELIGE
jgi:hydroxymethylbilane synthase